MGIVERVFVLVQRLQGSYEFEVQPLREYFCGKYLYETAPQSRAGFERAGTIVERFDAVARNRYWLNVTRFFAGSFSKGELPTLVHSIDSLLNDEVFSNLTSPRSLGVLLLRDWVFTPHVWSMNEVVQSVSDDLGIRMAWVGAHDEPVSLPRQCGRDVLVSKCKLRLLAQVPAQFAMELCRLIAVNTNDWCR
jgi:hypothetical protein